MAFDQYRGGTDEPVKKKPTAKCGKPQAKLVKPTSSSVGAMFGKVIGK